MTIFQRKNIPVEEEQEVVVPEDEFITNRLLDWKRTYDVGLFFDTKYQAGGDTGYCRCKVLVDCAFYICANGSSENCRFSMFAKSPVAGDAGGSNKKDARYKNTLVIGSYLRGSKSRVCLTPIIKAGTLVMVYGADNQHIKNKYYLIPTYKSAHIPYGDHCLVINGIEIDKHINYYNGEEPETNLSAIFV